MEICQSCRENRRRNFAQSSKPLNRKLESYLSKANKQNNVKSDKGKTFLKTRKRNEKYQKRKTWKRNKQEVPKNEDKEKKLEMKK